MQCLKPAYSSALGRGSLRYCDTHAENANLDNLPKPGLVMTQAGANPSAPLACWQCRASIASQPLPISRHATCDGCGYELHCCRQCSHYRPDQTGRCWEDRAEVPHNKEEYFVPTSPSASNQQDAGPSKAAAAKAQLDALFGGSDS